MKKCLFVLIIQAILILVASSCDGISEGVGNTTDGDGATRIETVDASQPEKPGEEQADTDIYDLIEIDYSKIVFQSGFPADEGKGNVYVSDKTELENALETVRLREPDILYINVAYDKGTSTVKIYSDIYKLGMDNIETIYESEFPEIEISVLIKTEIDRTFIEKLTRFSNVSAVRIYYSPWHAFDE